MNKFSSSSALATLSVLAIALQLSGCAKSGSTFDDDFANDGQSQEEAEGSATGTGNGGATGSNTSGSPGTGPGDVSEARCGNGVVEDNEDCDGADLRGATCQTLGFEAGGTLICDPRTCTFDESMCSRPPMQNPGSMGGRGG